MKIGFMEFVKKGAKSGMQAAKKIDAYMQEQAKKQDVRRKREMEKWKEQSEYMRQKTSYLKAQNKLSKEQEKKRRHQRQRGLGGSFLGGGW